MTSRNKNCFKLWCIKYVCCFCCESPRHDLITDVEVLDDLDRIFHELTQQDSTSLLKKYLNSEIFELIKYRQSPEGNTLKEVIACGLNNPECQIGIYSPDIHCYKTFAELFYPIIAHLQNLTSIPLHPGLPDFGPHGYFYIMDPHQRYVRTIRFEFSRNLQDFKLLPTMTHAELTHFQQKIIQYFQSFSGILKGHYKRLKEISESVKHDLTDLRLMPPEDDECLEAGLIRRHWPDGRGIFIPDSWNFVVWVNHEDHFRVVVTEEFGEFSRCYDRMIKIHHKFHERFQFHFDEELGYLTVSPSNIGNGLKGCIEVNLPMLRTFPEGIYDICERFNLTTHGLDGENSIADYNGPFFIRSTKTLGIDEFESVQPLYEGIIELLAMEEMMQTARDKAIESFKITREKFIKSRKKSKPQHRNTHVDAQMISGQPDVNSTQSDQSQEITSPPNPSPKRAHTIKFADTSNTE